MSTYSLTDITDSVKAKGENSTLLRFSSEGISPAYASKILVTYLLAEWPLTGSDREALRCYAMVLPHGKVHAVEVFFLRQTTAETLTGDYLGSSKIFSVNFKDNQYDPAVDDSLSENIWSKVCNYVPS